MGTSSDEDKEVDKSRHSIKKIGEKTKDTYHVIAAPMEEKTIKILEKIKKYYEDIEKRITPKALKETSDKIRSWIARHAPEREVVKTKDFSLFNANRQPAQMSETVIRIRNQTHDQICTLAKQQKELEIKALKGRIKIP